MSLRTKISIAVIATDALGARAVNERFQGRRGREADNQAQAQLAQARALYAQRAATLAAEGQAVALYPTVITAVA